MVGHFIPMFQFSATASLGLCMLLVTQLGKHFVTPETVTGEFTLWEFFWFRLRVMSHKKVFHRRESSYENIYSREVAGTGKTFRAAHGCMTYPWESTRGYSGDPRVARRILGRDKFWAGIPTPRVYPLAFSMGMTCTRAEREMFALRVSNTRGYSRVKITLS